MTKTVYKERTTENGRPVFNYIERCGTCLCCAIPVGYAYNGEPVYASASTITIGISGCNGVRDSTNTITMSFTEALTVDITESGAGGLDTGEEAANTWYAVHLIGDSSGTNSPAGMLSLSSSSPTVPSGYDLFRHIGWVRNNSDSDISAVYPNDIWGHRFIEITPTARDFTQATLTVDGTWKVDGLDLTTIVPDGAIAVVISYVLKDNLVGSNFALRQSATKAYNAGGQLTQAANAYINGCDVINIDSDRKLDYYATNGFDYIVGNIVGYWV